MADYSKPTPDWVEQTLRKFGRNPFGKNIYRVIWSETRVRWGDGKQVLEYFHLQPQWILEKWMSAEQYGSPEEWNQMRDRETGEIALGPYPNEGDWEHSYSFGHGTPLCATSIELICRLIEAGLARYNHHQRLEAIKAAKEKQRQAWRQRVADEFHEAQDAFRDADGISKPFSGPDGHRGSKTDRQLTLTTADVPSWLPRRAGFAQIKPPEK